MFASTYDVLDLGLRDPLDRLLDRASTLKANRSGSTSFVGGEEGSGRTALLDGFVAEASRGRSGPIVLFGTFDSGEYAPRNAALDRLKAATPLAEGVLGGVGALHPAAALVSQLVAASKAARQGVDGLAKKSRQEHPLVLLPELLRRTAQAEGPILCVIDDADRSGEAWWSDLMLNLSRQVAVDLPLMLVFAVQGPEELGDHEPDEPPSLFVARQLSEENLADWEPLRSRSAADVSRWIGPADSEVPRCVTEITGGRAGWTADLWDEWREDGIVRESEGVWSFQGDGVGGLSPVGHLVGRRLRRAVGDDLSSQAKAQQLLACAALEGRTFTAEALAHVLEQEVDGLIDFLDDSLSVDADPVRGLLEELPILTVRDEAGQRHLHRYRFRAELDWLALRHYGLPDEGQRRQRASSLAGALREVYGAAAGRVALVAAELFELAGEAENARNAQRMHNVMVDRATLVLRARQVSGISESASQAERNRAAEILAAGASALYHTGPWQQGLSFCEKALQITNVLPVERMALYYAAWFLLHLEDPQKARRYLERSLVGAEELRDRSAIADCLHQMANIDLTEHRFVEAEASYRDVLKIREAMEDNEARSRVHEALGDIRFRQDDYAGAMSEYELSATIATEIGDRHSWASTRFRIARIEFERGELDTCREALGEVIEILREHGDSRDEVAALSLLFEAEYATDRFEQAHAAAARAVEAWRETGNPDDATLLYRLATAEASLDRPESASSNYQAAAGRAEEEGESELAAMSRRAIGLLELAEKEGDEAEATLQARLKMAVAAGDRAEEGSVRQQLAELLYSEDRAKEARAGFRRALEIHLERGDLDSQAVVYAYLGFIAYDLDDFEAADRPLRQALALLERSGDREWEASVSMYLGALEATRGQDRQARRRLQRALALQREIGDTEGEANTLRLLGEIGG
jgi:tetratricopeptide (TPR) repeat protein